MHHSLLYRALTLTFRAGVAGALLGACGDDDSSGSSNQPDGGVDFVYQCGPIFCGTGQACVWDPVTQPRETFRCVEDIECGLDAFLECNMTCSPNPSLPDRECEARCQEQFLMTTLHYGCLPNPPGACTENAEFPIVRSPLRSDAGVPLDPTTGMPGGPEAGNTRATFMICRR